MHDRRPRHARHPVGANRRRTAGSSEAIQHLSTTEAWIAPSPALLAMPARSDRASPALLDQIVFENRHLELERAIVVLIIDEQHADELLADIDLGRIVF